jgi:hypothetical protein
MLSIDILGKPAHAIVMENMGSRFKKNLTFQLEPEEAAQPINLLDSLQQQASVLTADDVTRNIDELQPKNSRSLSAEEFDSLQDILVSGFTVTQLATYVHQYHGKHGDKSTEIASRQPPWIAAYSPWLPDVQFSKKKISPSLVGYVTKTLPPKAFLALQLMRECWGVSSQAVESLTGQLEVRVRDLEFALLLRESILLCLF